MKRLGTIAEVHFRHTLAQFAAAAVCIVCFSCVGSEAAAPIESLSVRKPRENARAKTDYCHRVPPGSVASMQKRCIELLDFLRNRDISEIDFECIGVDSEWAMDEYQHARSLNISALTISDCLAIERAYRSLEAVARAVADYEIIEALRSRKVPKVEIEHLQRLPDNGAKDILGNSDAIRQSAAHCYYAFYLHVGVLMQCCDSAYFKSKLSDEGLIMLHWRYREWIWRKHDSRLLSDIVQLFLTVQEEFPAFVWKSHGYFTRTTKAVLLAIGYKLSIMYNHYQNTGESDSLSTVFSIVSRKDMENLLEVMREQGLCDPDSESSVCTGLCARSIRANVCERLEAILKIRFE